MSVGSTGGTNVLEGARRSPTCPCERIGDVDRPRDGTVVDCCCWEPEGVVNPLAEAGRAVKALCEDLRLGTFNLCSSDGSAGTNPVRGWCFPMVCQVQVPV